MLKVENCTKKFNEEKIFNKTLLETAHFRVIPSIGAFIEGWVLLIPKDHLISFASVKEKYSDELEMLHSKTIELLKSLYNTNICVFENGAIENSSSIGCGVDYAHIHYLPLNFDIKKEVDKHYNYKLNWQVINNFIEIKSSLSLSKPYLFIENNFGIKQVALIQNPESQLIRKILANHCNILKEYDWKEHLFIENVFSIIDKFRKVQVIESMYEHS